MAKNISVEFSAITKSKWFLVALIFFLIAAILGTAMRFFFLAEIPFLDFKHLLHAHSHTAMLGWCFTLVSGALLFLFLKDSNHVKQYKRAFSLNIVAGIGMAVFFTYQGYGAFSIGFSILHLIAAYWFGWYFLRDLKRSERNSSTNFARWSVYWMLISTLGLWSIAPISAYLGKADPLYYSSVQFFLHFQFNGWFTYAVIALLLVYFSKVGKPIEIRRSTFWLLQISLMLTYALSITWSTPETFLFYLNSLGVLVQAVAFYPILKKLFIRYRQLLIGSKVSHWLLGAGLLSLFLKILAQMAVAVPVVAEISYTIRNFVIGFIHLTMLGSISLTLIAVLLLQGLFPEGGFAQSGYLALLFAFISTEVLLFLQGILLWMGQGFMPGYYEMIFGATAIFPIAIALVIVQWIKMRSHD